jgi:DNA polymerase-3 subunit beta
MKFIVSKSSLEAAVKNLYKVIDPKAALPILGNILFDVDESGLVVYLTASDSEITLKYEIALDKAEGYGKFCVSADRLADMLGELKDQPLTILATTESDMKFTLEYKDGSAYCAIENADEYPLPQDSGEGIMVDLPPATIKSSIKRSLWAVADDENRPIMNGINFGFGPGQLEVVASDGHKIIKSSYKDNYIKASGSFVMPKKVAKVVPGIFVGDVVDAGLTFNDKWCRIEYDACELQFRLIEGKYPNYNSVIPTEYKQQVYCNIESLASAVKAVNPFTNDSSNMVVFHFDDGNLEVSGEDFDFSVGASRKIAVSGFKGEPMNIGLKAQNVISLLSKMGGKAVWLKFSEIDRAFVISPVYEDEDKEELKIIGLTMPMLTND